VVVVGGARKRRERKRRKEPPAAEPPPKTKDRESHSSRPAASERPFARKKKTIEIPCRSRKTNTVMIESRPLPLYYNLKN
jgi:hypothetical protein